MLLFTRQCAKPELEVATVTMQLLNNTTRQAAATAGAPKQSRNVVAKAFSRTLFSGKGADIGLPPLSSAQPQADRTVPQATATPGAPAASSGAPKLPWQVAMSEIKKRRDLKTIMILGAGPIVIGQVTALHLVWGRQLLASMTMHWCGHGLGQSTLPVVSPRSSGSYDGHRCTPRVFLGN